MDVLSLLKPAGGPASPQATGIVRAIGIDLGTTNSTLTEIVWEPGQPGTVIPRVIEVEQPTNAGAYTGPLVPSVVAIEGGKTLVGEGARRLLAKGIAQGDEYRTVFAECKNEIGARRTYHKAPEGYRTASEIAGHVLKFLKDAAFADDPQPASRVVVTVPASFQAAQRADTIKAAMTAGIPIAAGDLLDEPVAAFLDYLVTHRETLVPKLRKPKTLLVFDFGGGTCDVAIFRPMAYPAGDGWQMNPLSVSRYHRLGGGDLDRAVVHEVLLPQFLDQNGMNPHDLDFDQRKREFEPAYIGAAEALKVGICTEIARLQAFGRYTPEDRATVVKTLPGTYPCTIAGREFLLKTPKLSAEQWEKLLAPFLDRDMLAARETEYRLTCSIFAPLQDSLERAGIDREDVGLCLLVGGSSLIPQISPAMQEYLPNAEMLTYPDHESVQLAVARGAAYHAFSLALFGRSVFRSVLGDTLSIQTSAGPIELIPRGVELPWPADGKKAVNGDLRVPATAGAEGTEMRVELIAGPEARLVMRQVIRLVGVKRGDALRLEYAMDENQGLDFSLRPADSPDARPFAIHVENPYTNVVNPNEVRVKIQEAEENLRTGRIPPGRVADEIVEIARNYAELQQLEKALDYLSRALRMRNRPDGYILNLMGIYYGNLGDRVREEKFYREAAAAWPGDGAPHFNLALAFRRRGDLVEAQEAIDLSILREREGPALTLAAQIAEGEGRQAERDRLLEEALKLMSAVTAQNDWELGWLRIAAQMAGRTDVQEAVAREQRRRRSRNIETAATDGSLPDQAHR